MNRRSVAPRSHYRPSLLPIMCPTNIPPLDIALMPINLRTTHHQSLNRYVFIEVRNIQKTKILRQNGTNIMCQIQFYYVWRVKGWKVIIRTSSCNLQYSCCLAATDLPRLQACYLTTLSHLLRLCMASVLGILLSRTAGIMLTAGKGNTCTRTLVFVGKRSHKKYTFL
jgi:hypothetical protein